MEENARNRKKNEVFSVITKVAEFSIDFIHLLVPHKMPNDDVIKIVLLDRLQFPKINALQICI